MGSVLDFNQALLDMNSLKDLILMITSICIEL